PGKSYSNPNPHTGRSRYVPSVLVSPSHTQTQTRTEHPMTLSVTPVCVLCTLVVGGRDYCVYLMTIWREGWFVKVVGSNAISSAEAGAPNEESENERRERG